MVIAVGSVANQKGKGWVPSNHSIVLVLITRTRFFQGLYIWMLVSHVGTQRAHWVPNNGVILPHKKLLKGA